MSTPNERSELEFEDQLRQILKAEAGEVQPSAEGLNLIRERTERQRGSAWFGLPWLRPAAAVAAAVLIVASVIMSSPQVRDQVLEIVPAGADREGSPPEAQQGGGDSVAAPEPTTDSATGTSKPVETPGQSPEDGSSPKGAPSAAEDEGPEATSSCPSRDGTAPTSANGTRDEDSKDDDRDSPDSDHPDCDPSDEPAEEPTDEPTGPGGGGDPTPEPDPDSGSGGSSGGGSGSSGNGDEDNGTSQN